jgi:hypothetical protein
MSRRISIVNSLATELKKINGTAPYNVNLFNNVVPKLKFWDEVQDFPSVYISPGTELREYHPSNFKWAFLGVSIKAYCHGENSSDQLELLLQDIEYTLDGLDRLVYNTTAGLKTAEIMIQSITTDEGLLAPYAVGEINLQVRYAVP